MKKISILGKIQNNIKEAKTEATQLQEYLSTFDFESFEIQETDKAFIIQKEEVFNKYGRVYANSLYEICIALSEVSDRLKNNNEIGFTAWYKHIGLNKDKVSELLKRAQLYTDFPEHQAFISSLSGLAVRIITKKEISSANQKQLLENKITAVKDIKEILNINNDDEIIKVSNNFRYFNPNTLNKLQKNLITMDAREISETKKEIEYYKKMLKEVEKELELKEKEYENTNNLKLEVIK